jgi:hypothetical protein
MIDGGMKPGAVAEWNNPPFSEAESLELGKKRDAGECQARTITREWTRLFKEKHERIMQLAG